MFAWVDSSTVSSVAECSTAFNCNIVSPLSRYLYQFSKSVALPDIT